MILIRVTEPEFHTILAALRFYQEHGQGNPMDRSDEIHELATNDQRVVALDDAGIDRLCQRMNTEYEFTS